MPIRLIANQYAGVNAHLHSYLQRHNEWPMFHDAHINHLREALQELLPLESGYLVVAEKSLQIKQHSPEEDRTARRRLKPDIPIYRQRENDSLLSTASHFAPTAVFPATATIDEPEYFTSLVIYRAQENTIFGRPVTRIELLSPANKPGGSHHQQYLAKRDETLLSGIKLVEIDYLHERPSPVSILPSYPHREQGAYPYAILINDPTPAITEGETRAYGFRVDSPIPSIAVPLDGSDTVAVDLNMIYSHTFAANNVFGGVIVDYETLPEGFHTYDDIDQQRIRDRMAIVVDTYKNR